MTSPIRFVYQAPSAEAYNELRRDAGWAEMDPGTAEACLPRSLLVVCACEGDRVVGTGRIVGDGGLCFYIQDVIVLKAYQGLGIGAGIMDRLMAWIGDRAVQDTFVGLMAAVGKEGFYRRYGFVSRPDEGHGCGMTRFWNTA